MKNLPIKGALLAAAAGLVLVACGGGGDSGFNAQTDGTPPASASASTQGFLEFIDGLVAQALDGREPYDVSALTLPTDDADTKEPVRLSIDQ